MDSNDLCFNSSSGNSSIISNQSQQSLSSHLCNERVELGAPEPANLEHSMVLCYSESGLQDAVEWPQPGKQVPGTFLNEILGWRTSGTQT